MVDGTDGYNLCCADPKYDSYLCSSVICLHSQDNFEIPFCSANEKPFLTCSSHMRVVSITYGTCIFIYLNPTAKGEVTIKKVVSLLIFSVSSMLNSFLYTFRNNQVKKAFKDSMKRIALLSSKYERIFLKYHLKRIGRRLFRSL